jgi:hypothetical protein
MAVTTLKNLEAAVTLRSAASSDPNGDTRCASVGVGPAQSPSMKMVFWAATISHRPSSSAIT